MEMPKEQTNDNAEPPIENVEMPTEPNQDNAMAKVVNQHLGSEINSINIEGVGMCLSAVDIVSVLLGKTRHNSREYTGHLLKSSKKEEAAKVLHRKAVVPSFWEPTYVINYKEILHLLRLLPPQYPAVRALLDEVDRVFHRVRAGDQSLHSDINKNAES
eukprot:1026703-Rhodomonas_salina.1